MPFCTSCGTQNPEEAKFCFKCGTELVTPEGGAGSQPPEHPTDATETMNLGGTDTSDRNLSPVDAAAVDGLPSGHALLVVQRGPGAGQRFLLDDDETYVGRHPSCEIFLDDITVSRRHAKFERRGSNFTVADAGSLNGTYVNRDRIEQTTLTDGDEVQIGKFRLVFFSSHESA